MASTWVIKKNDNKTLHSGGNGDEVQLMDVGLCCEVDRGKIKNLMGLTEEGEWLDEDESISGCNKWYKPEDSYGEYVGQKPIDCCIVIYI